MSSPGLMLFQQILYHPNSWSGGFVTMFVAGTTLNAGRPTKLANPRRQGSSLNVSEGSQEPYPAHPRQWPCPLT
eukprot:9653837-Heterocapsa_arctica.AAC.1